MNVSAYDSVLEKKKKDHLEKETVTEEPNITLSPRSLRDLVHHISKVMRNGKTP
jgi:hypothetical protein